MRGTKRSDNRLWSPRFCLGLAALTVLAAPLWLAVLAVVSPRLLGWQPVVLTSASMAPALDAGDVVLASPHNGPGLARGTVVVFEDPAGGGLITHRVDGVRAGGTYRTRGDANRLADSTPLDPDRVVAVGRAVVPKVGLPVVWARAGAWGPIGASLALLGTAAGTAVWGLRGPNRPRRRTAPAVPAPTAPSRRTVRALAVVIAVQALLASACALAPQPARAAFYTPTANGASTFAAGTWATAGIALDNTSSAPSVGKVSSHSWSHTVGSGSDRILVVGVSLRKHDMSVSSITYGGAGDFVFAGTQIGGGADHRVEIWYKVAPPVGTATIAITLAGGANVEIVGGSASFTGVHQTVPTGTFVGAFGTSQTPSVALSSATNEVVVDVLSNSGDTGSTAVGANQTQRWSRSTGTGDPNEFGACSTEPGAASVAMSWSMGNSNKWAIGAIALKPSATS